MRREQADITRRAKRDIERQTNDENRRVQVQSRGARVLEGMVAIVPPYSGAERAEGRGFLVTACASSCAPRDPARPRRRARPSRPGSAVSARWTPC